MRTDALAPRTRPTVLIISMDHVGPEMSGLGIRCLEIAKELAAFADVTIAATGGTSTVVDGIRVE